MNVLRNVTAEPRGHLVNQGTNLRAQVPSGTAQENSAAVLMGTQEKSGRPDYAQLSPKETSQPLTSGKVTVDTKSIFLDKEGFSEGASIDLKQPNKADVEFYPFGIQLEWK